MLVVMSKKKQREIVHKGMGEDPNAIALASYRGQISTLRSVWNNSSGIYV